MEIKRRSYINRLDRWAVCIVLGAIFMLIVICLLMMTTQSVSSVADGKEPKEPTNHVLYYDTMRGRLRQTKRSENLAAARTDVKVDEGEQEASNIKTNEKRWDVFVKGAQGGAGEPGGAATSMEKRRRVKDEKTKKSSAVRQDEDAVKSLESGAEAVERGKMNLRSVLKRKARPSEAGQQSSRYKKGEAVGVRSVVARQQPNNRVKSGPVARQNSDVIDKQRPARNQKPNDLVYSEPDKLAVRKLADPKPDRLAGVKPGNFAGLKPGKSADPKSGKLTDPKEGKITDLKPDEIADPKPDKITDPKPDKITDPKPDKITDPKPDKITDPKPDKIADPKQDEIADPKPDKITDPKPDEIADPEPDKISDPKPDNIADPKPGKIADPKPDKIADPKPGKIADPDSGKFADTDLQ